MVQQMFIISHAESKQKIDKNDNEVTFIKMKFRDSEIFGNIKREQKNKNILSMLVFFIREKVEFMLGKYK